MKSSLVNVSKIKIEDWPSKEFDQAGGKGEVWEGNASGVRNLMIMW